MKLKKLLTGHLLVLALVFPHAVSAEDFTVNLEVKFSKILPDVTSIKILCIAQTSKEKLGSKNKIGQRGMDFEVPSNGELNQTVQIRFDAFPGKNPADATIVQCYFNLVGQGATTLPVSGNPPLCNLAIHAWKCSKPGTALTQAVYIDIP